MFLGQEPVASATESTEAGSKVVCQESSQVWGRPWHLFPWGSPGKPPRACTERRKGQLGPFSLIMFYFARGQVTSFRIEDSVIHHLLQGEDSSAEALTEPTERQSTDIDSLFAPSSQSTTCVYMYVYSHLTC